MDPMVRPRISLLEEGHIEYIHARSLEILSVTGVRVDSPQALEVLRRSESRLSRRSWWIGLSKAPPL